MSINCGAVGVIPFTVAPSDEYEITFDKTAWLDTTAISSVVYSAVDEHGNDVTTDVLVAAKHSNTTTVVSVYIKGGTHGLSYTAKFVITANNADASKKTFYIKWSCLEVAS